MTDVGDGAPRPLMIAAQDGAMGRTDLLSDGDIWAVLAFIKSRWPPECPLSGVKRT